MKVNLRTKRAIRALVGDPMGVAESLAAYSCSARALSETQPDFLKRYSKRWIAISGGKVVADAATLDALLAATDKKELPRSQILVRYIERSTRKLILQWN